MTIKKINVRLVLPLFTGILLFIGVLPSEKLLADSPNSLQNPYIELYRLRVTQAELNLDRKVAVEKLAVARLGRTKRLYEKGAMTLEDFETSTSEASVAEAERVLATKKIEESKAYLKIITALVEKGISIPLCTYEME